MKHCEAPCSDSDIGPHFFLKKRHGDDDDDGRETLPYTCLLAPLGGHHPPKKLEKKLYSMASC